MPQSRRRFLASLSGALAAPYVLRGQTPMPGSPLDTYPSLETALRQQADGAAKALSRGGSVRFESVDGAVSDGFGQTDAKRGAAGGQPIAPDGLLVFAVDVSAATYVEGTLFLDPADDLRDRAFARPSSRIPPSSGRRMVAASEWSIPKVTDPAPVISPGQARARSRTQSMAAGAGGRHYLTVDRTARTAGGNVQGPRDPIDRSSGRDAALHLRPDRRYPRAFQRPRGVDEHQDGRRLSGDVRLDAAGPRARRACRSSCMAAT